MMGQSPFLPLSVNSRSQQQSEALLQAVEKGIIGALLTGKILNGTNSHNLKSLNYPLFVSCLVAGINFLI